MANMLLKMPRPADDSIEQAIETYLLTGDHDPHYSAWTGHIIERERRAFHDLLQALWWRVSELTACSAALPESSKIDPVQLTRARVAPMVSGLFPRSEQAAVLTLVERSVTILTADNIERVLLESGWLSTAWDIANLYLASRGAPLLGETAPSIAGLSANMRCFVSAAYFEETDPFADFIVHEVAHILHDCRRRVAGLHQTRRRERLLEIEFRKRETFAYACEVFARISDRTRSRRDRIALADEYGETGHTADERATHHEIAEIIREASASRNGWKVILRHCVASRSTQCQDSRLFDAHEASSIRTERP